MNKLYFGDNREILAGTDIPERSVDLIYLDPPFNSKAEYNVLFESPRDRSSAQAGAFLDTWTWGEEADWAYRQIMRGGGPIARYIDALRSALNQSDLMAYLVMMAIRLVALHRVLKRSGSLFLHCDPTASHYLKILLDAIFGPGNFRNEIVWKRTFAHGNVTRRLGDVTDTILYYAKDASACKWNQPFTTLTAKDADQKYPHVDPDGRRWQSVTLRNPGMRPNLHFPYKASNGVTYQPHPNGWSCNLDRMQRYDREGRLHFPAKAGGALRLKMYEDESPGERLQSLWDDIPPIGAQARERLGYPTQKPLALLERIIAMASNEGDLVLDPFCGCGTTIEAAQHAKRQWIGIDIAIHAIKVIEARLAEHFRKSVKYEIEGIPRDYASAKRLAELNPYQFQWWANYLFNPHAIREQKKGADRGIDGELYFPNGPGRPWGRMLTSVKGGENVGPTMIRDFAHVLDREKAELGLFLCLNKPTREMQRAASIGIADTVHGDIPRLQIVSIEEWFQGKLPKLPPLEHLPSAAFSTAKRRAAAAMAAPPDPNQPELPFVFTGGKGKRGETVHFNPQMVRISQPPASEDGAASSRKNRRSA